MVFYANGKRYSRRERKWSFLLEWDKVFSERQRGSLLEKEGPLSVIFGCRAIRGLLWNNPRIGRIQKKRTRASMTELKTTEQSADYSGAFRGSLQGRWSFWGTPHGSEDVSQERGKCVCLCFVSILHGRKRSVRQADTLFNSPCLLVTREIAKFISLYLLSLSLSPL